MEYRERRNSTIYDNEDHDMERTVYIKGVNNDFMARVQRNPKPFLQELNDEYHMHINTKLSDWKPTGESIRIPNLTSEQKQRILKLTRIGEKSVEITEPWALTRNNDNKQVGAGEQQGKAMGPGRLKLYSLRFTE